MNTRQSRIDFDRNYCAHYAPKPGSLKSDYCALGCGASEMMAKARKAGEPNMSPCIGGHKAGDVLALCPKWERRSLEHAEKRADAIEEEMDRMDIVMPVVNEWRTWKKTNRVAKQGVIECPKCKGPTPSQPIELQWPRPRGMRDAGLRLLDGVGMIYVYSDYSENFDNHKRKHLALAPVVAAIVADDILAADALFQAQNGINPARVDYIWCAPMNEDKLAGHLKYVLNQKSERVNFLRLEVRARDYTIYGLENPWLKKQPDYMI